MLVCYKFQIDIDVVTQIISYNMTQITKFISKLHRLSIDRELWKVFRHNLCPVKRIYNYTFSFLDITNQTYLCVCVIVTFTGFGLIFLNFLQVHGMLLANSVHFFYIK